MEDILTDIASKKSPFVRWATQLWIHDLLPSCTKPDTHMEDLLRLQSELLVSAIESLTKVHSARYASIFVCSRRYLSRV